MDLLGVGLIVILLVWVLARILIKYVNPPHKRLPPAESAPPASPAQGEPSRSAPARQREESAKKSARPPDLEGSAPPAPPRPSPPPAPAPLPQAVIPAVELPPLPEVEEEADAEAGEAGGAVDVDAPPSSVAVAEPVQFTTYYPKEVAPQVWHTLAAYMFRESAAQDVIDDAQDLLGGRMATLRRVEEAATQNIPEGTFITATPYLKGFQFNPPSLTLGFYDAWQRFDFKLRAGADVPLFQAVNGWLTFTVEGVIVADVPLAVFISPDAPAPFEGTANPAPPPDNNMATMSHKPYRAVFCSYSRSDTAIIERVERAIRTLGYDFLRDVHTIRSGEDWNDALYRLIEEADIFQLFWSEKAAQSEYVMREWRHALSLKREGQNFIRPVYWQTPMPPVPVELGHIHFAHEPGLGK